MQTKDSYLLTGANSPLGLSFANYLSQNIDGRILLTSRTMVDFSELTSKEHIFYLPNIDLTKELDIQNLKREVARHLPDKFHVINCIGYFPGYSNIDQTSMVEVRRVFDSNLFALFAIAKEFIPLMKERKGGHFVAFSTHTAYQNYPEMTAFTAAKVGVESLIKGIANECSQFDILANCFALATLLTKVEEKIKPHGDHENWLQTGEVCATVVKLIMQHYTIMNGNVIHLFKHSDSFFHQSYYERIAND